MNVVLLLLLAAGSPPCTFEVPEGWTAVAPAPGEVQAVEEPYQRDNLVIRTRIALRAQEPGKLDEALRRARAEEQARLGAKPDFELVRDGPVPSAGSASHLLVYRYRDEPNGKVKMRFHAVFSNGFQVVHAVADSQARVVDALHTPYREAAIHEKYVRGALASVRCVR